MIPGLGAPTVFLVGHCGGQSGDEAYAEASPAVVGFYIEAREISNIFP